MGPKSFYIAAPFYARAEARAARRELERRGFESTARWLDSHLDDLDALDSKVREREAREDLADVYRADAFILLNNTGQESSSGGMHVEFGYALAMRKPIFLVGERTSIFHHFDRVMVFPTVEALFNVGNSRN